MDMLRVYSLEDVASLPLTPWNIPQPASTEGRENPLTSGVGLDLILVPGLGFTEASSLGHSPDDGHYISSIYTGWAEDRKREGEFFNSLLPLH